jgi:hypothetical protein
MQYSPSAKAGRLKLLMNLISVVAISALVGISTILINPADAYKPLVRFSLTLLLCYGAFVGNRFAVLIFSALLAVGALSGLSLGLTSLAGGSWGFIALFSMSICYGYCAFSLMTSASIKQFWQEQRASRDKS